MKKTEYDFGGWATKNDLLCSDGRTIRRNAFKDDDGRIVPLVYQHNHEDPTRVIGHALLENRKEGVYAYCSLNATDTAQHIKECVRHHDINGLSIYANKLTQSGGDVLHGTIRELSIVLAGANPGAVIEFPLLSHGEESETEAYIWCGETDITFGGGMELNSKGFAHSDDEEEDDKEPEDKEIADELSKVKGAKKDATVQEVIDSMSDKQRNILKYLIGKAFKSSNEDEDEDDENEDKKEDDEVAHADGDSETVQDVLESMTSDQQKVTKYLVAKAIENQDSLNHSEDEDSDSTVQDVLDSMTPEQRKVTEYLVGMALEGENATDDSGDVSHSSDDEGTGRTVQDVLDSMNPNQRKVVNFLVAKAIETKELKDDGDYDEEDDENQNEDEDDKNVAHSYEYEGEELIMKKNVFDNDAMTEQNEDVLTHAQMDMILNDAKRIGSLRGSVLEHAAEYGIDQIDYLFPDYRNLTNTPGFISRDMGWVDKVMGAVSKTPFSRIKTMFADITEDQARARGYITKKLKKTEVFTLLKRTTDPQTIYKYQKLDRDDILDIVDFDVVAWMKTEMRMMLNEEIARAILIGDGRDADSDDHINENHIRSILRDSELFSLHYTVPVVTNEDQAKTFIKTLRAAWEFYEGRGNCTAYMPEGMLNKLKLLEDGIGHFLYPTNDTVASVLGVKEVVSVPVMKDKSTIRVVTSETAPTKYYRPLAIIVNLGDYNVGADKGGSVNMFEDFDIKYNQNEYLIETRCSGALIRPHSAIVIEEEVAAPTTDDTNP